MLDIKSIADEIEKKIAQIDVGRKILIDRIDEKARAISEYDKRLAIRILELQSEGTPATLCEKLAKGDCWQQRLEMEKAEGMYKAATSGMESLMAQLNGLQSIFRHLSHT